MRKFLPNRALLISMVLLLAMLFTFTAGTAFAASATSTPAVSSYGRVIVVSLSHQSMTVYYNGHKIYSSLVTTGRPELRTPTGTFHIFRKLRNVIFHSPWRPGSPYYYPPEHVNYAMQITWNGIFLHDATWRSVFGPGTNVWHKDPKFGWMTGSHGCVNLPLSTAAWLYKWATIGTTVRIIN